jgi:hypothetical protein
MVARTTTISAKTGISDEETVKGWEYLLDKPRQRAVDEEK